MNIRKIFLVACLLALPAASVTRLTGSVQRTLNDNQYVAHEWGTFTSLQGSNGANQVGLHHGDEELPRFVHCPLGFSYSRCLSLLESGEGQPLATTQRMETPVIYFYSKLEREVDVNVKFPKGLLTEWFPKATSYTPKAGEVTTLENGLMRWRTSVRAESQPIPQAPEDSIWNAQRKVDANYVTVEGENEKFIFYRGIGRFTVPFLTKTDAKGGLTLENTSVENIPSVILLNFDGEKGAFRHLGSLPGTQTLKLAANEIPNAAYGDPTELYVQKISALLLAQLTAAGLYTQEAQAMVDTWKRSYFQTPGLRALYILPRSWTDEIVPLDLNPAPMSLVRTFVGRIEIFTAREEEKLLADIRAHIASGKQVWEMDISALGRFMEPKLWRLRQLAADDTERQFILDLKTYNVHEW